MEIMFGHSRMLIKRLGAEAINLGDKRLAQNPFEFFKANRFHLTSLLSSGKPHLLVHQNDARMLFLMLSQLSRSTEASKNILRSQIQLYQNDLIQEKLELEAISMIAMPDKLWLWKDGRLSQWYYLDSDFNEQISAFVDCLNFEENHIDLTYSKESIEKQFSKMMGDYDLIESMLANSSPSVEMKSREIIDQLKGFINYAKRFHRKLEQADCLDLYLKPLITRFSKLFYKPTLPEKRLRKEFINPLNAIDKQHILLKIVEQYAHNWAAICANREVKTIYRDERFAEFFALMNRFDVFSSLGLQFKDIGGISNKQIVRQMTADEFLSQPKKFIDISKSIH